MARKISPTKFIKQRIYELYLGGATKAELMARYEYSYPTIAGIINQGKQMQEQQNWYFTFGSAHAHPNGYIKLQGSFSEARAKMFELFDSKWSMQYNEKQFEGQAERYGLHEVEL